MNCPIRARNAVRFVAEISGKARWRTTLPDESRQDGSPPRDLSAVPPRYLALLAPGSRSLSLACHGSFHLDFHTHPRVDAALKKMFTFRQTRDLAFGCLEGFGSWPPRRSKSRRHIREPCPLRAHSAPVESRHRTAPPR